MKPLVESEENTKIVEEVEFGVAFRWQHWIRALSILILTVSGFYLAYPFLSPEVNAEPIGFLYALSRSWHEIFGFLLIAALLFKVYLFLFAPMHANERSSLVDFLNPIAWIRQIGYYLLINKHPPLRGAYNPVQFFAYIMFYLMMIALVITGLVLYVHVYHDGLGAFLYEPMRSIEVMLGGLSTVRSLHHILMWAVIIFVVVHVYMVVYNAIFSHEGAVDAIFSGHKWKKKKIK
jgi:Ni/Fe-hydrogenase 1 B-type cytochrome subunit